MKKNDRQLISRIFTEKLWKNLLDSKIEPSDIVAVFSFKECMHFIPVLLGDPWEDDTLKIYAIRLMRKIREHFDKEWDADWKNDAYLGAWCNYLSMWDESYKNLKKAYDKIKDPPAKLLIRLAQCASVPGIPPIDLKEEERLSKAALEKELTVDTAMRMHALSFRKQDLEQKAYWKKMWEKLEADGIYSDPIIPDVINDIVI